MAVRPTESRIPATLTTHDLGQASLPVMTGSGGYTLISYLTSPVVVLTRLDYVLFALHGAGGDEYHWKVEALPSPGTVITSKVTEEGVFNWTASATGDVRVSVQVFVSGTAIATLELVQTVQNRNAAVEALLAPYVAAGTAGAAGDTLRELVNDLKDYIVAGATATGVAGIPSVLLAAVLYIETNSRPKEGTVGAAAKRKAWDEDDIRDVELESLADIYDDSLGIRRHLYAATSLGVGQIAQTTAAMALGKIVWRDQDITARNVVRDQILADYRNLSDADRIDIYNQLRFPKTNVALAAQLLAKLKNRTHRWPTVARDTLVATPSAVEVIATEYNMGSTTTPSATAKPNWYGLAVRNLVTPGSDPSDLPTFFP